MKQQFICSKLQVTIVSMEGNTHTLLISSPSFELQMFVIFTRDKFPLWVDNKTRWLDWHTARTRFVLDHLLKEWMGFLSWAA